MEHWAKVFWERRKSEEKHDLSSYYVHSPRMMLVQILATGYPKNYYYMSIDELMINSIELHKQVATDDPDFHINSLLAFRNIAFIKDQVILGMMMHSLKLDIFRRNREKLLEILDSFPPNLLLRYVTMFKFMKGYLKKGLGTKEKRLVADTIKSWSIERAEYYAMRYPSDLYDLLNLVHPKLSGELKNIMGYVVASKKEKRAPTDRLKAYEKAKEHFKKKEWDEALNLVIDYDLPFELIRRYVSPREYSGNKQLLEYALKKTIPPNAMILNLRYLISLIGDFETSNVVRCKGLGKTTAYDVLKAYVAISGNNPYTENALEIKFSEAISTVRHLLLPELDIPFAVACIDASGSMIGWYYKFSNLLYNSLANVATFAPVIKSVVAFDTKAFIEPIDLSSPSKLKIAYDYLNSKYGGGTNIDQGLFVSLEEANRLNIDTIILFTDEQENVANRPEEYDAAEAVIKEGKKLIVVNPSPYPAHAVRPSKKVIYVPAATPNAMLASLRLIQLYKLDEDQVIRYVEKLVERKV